ncbi:MAG: hypothetical protein EXR73_10890 [Myxococcales bacterium]|nr:hypothetical protein [Myxococcales bacterium]
MTMTTMKTLSALILLTALAAPTAGCSTSADDGAVDSGPIVLPPDARNVPRADANVTPPTCTAAADYGAVTVENQGASSRAMMMGATVPDVIDGGGSINTDMAPDYLSLQLFKGYSVFPMAITPGTYQITGEELNYATCAVCVILYTDLIDTGMGGVPTDTYLATAGTVELISVMGNLKANLSGLQFRHVNIDDMSFESMPHPSGCSSAVTSAAFDTPIVPSMP